MNPILLLIAAALPGAGLAIHAQPAPLSVAQDITELIAQLEGDDPTQKLAAAERIKGLGKRGAKAVPALMRLLPSGDGPLVGASVEALVAVGPKARAALLEALESGSFEGEPMPPGPVSAALLQLGKRARVAVEAYIQAAERGPALFLTLEELGPAGLPFLVDAAAEGGATTPDALRSIRRLAAREVRTDEPLAKALKRVDDEDLAGAITVSWTQAPGRADVEDLGRWIESDRPELAETGLWAAGLMGGGAASLAGQALSRAFDPDPFIRRSALWAVGSMVSGEPGSPVDVIPASFPGASASARKRVEAAAEGDAVVIWREAGKPLGFRGRVGDQARKLWAIAPTWTFAVEPYPAAPDPDAAPAPVQAAIGRLISSASGWAADAETEIDAVLASRILSQAGVTSEAAVALWAGWLEAESAGLRREALVGMRSIGRGAIEHEALVIQQLADPTTQVVAAQVLAAIATPTAWTAAVEAVAAIDGKPPFAMLAAIGRFDLAALRPGLGRFRELYREGHYIMAALMIRFGDEVVEDFTAELGAGLADRRMVAAESLGHMGASARPALPKLRALKERSPIAQKLLVDAISRIEAGG